MQKLSSRQQAIFDMLLNGASPKEIASKLNISYNTVLTHQKKLYRTLGVNSIQELIIKYLPNGAAANGTAGITELSVMAEQGLVPADGDLPTAALRNFPAINQNRNWLTGKWQGGFLCGIIASALVLLAVLLAGRLTHAGTTNETPTLISHSFDTIRLRAIRWNNHNNILEQDMLAHGEQWMASQKISVTELPAHIDRITSGNDRYTITISGTSNQDIDFVFIVLQGITKENNYLSFGETDTSNYIQLKANRPFNETYPVNIHHECDLADYKEIELGIINDLQYIHDTMPGFSRINGSIPEDIPDGTIMASISDFKVSLNDTRK